MEVISRKEAKVRGLIKYFTGNPCCYGHAAERWVANYNCVICQIDISKKHREENQQEINKKARNWRALNPDKSRDATLRKRHGIGTAEYESMLRSQDNKCAICYTNNPNTTHGFFDVDHCHTTLKIRGLLCHHCNISLGGARDNPSTLRAAADYLERNSTTVREAA